MYSILKNIVKSNFRFYLITKIIIFILNFFSIRIFILNNHFGNASEEILLNSFLAYKNKEKICCLENYFYKNKHSNPNFPNLINKNNNYTSIFFKRVLSFIFSLEQMINKIFLIPLILIFRHTRYYQLLVEFSEICYTGKNYRVSELNNFNYKIYNKISKGWYFKKIKNEKEYLLKKFSINFKKKIVLIHNRTSNFYGDFSHRNENINSFLPTIKWLLKKNFYVILFGENNLNFKNDNLLNYSNILDKDRIDDILLLKNIDHIICSASGPCELAHTFNKKIILINGHNLLAPYILNSQSYTVQPTIYLNKKIINGDLNYLITTTNPRIGKNNKLFYKKLNAFQILKIVKKIFIYKNFNKCKFNKKHTVNYKKFLLRFYNNTEEPHLNNDRFRYIYKVKNAKGTIIPNQIFFKNNTLR